MVKFAILEEGDFQLVLFWRQLGLLKINLILKQKQKNKNRNHKWYFSGAIYLNLKNIIQKWKQTYNVKKIIDEIINEEKQKLKALIFGVTGQDGSKYLSEFLLKKNYVVHGVKEKAQASIQIELITFFIKINLNYIMGTLQMHQVYLI